MTASALLFAGAETEAFAMTSTAVISESTSVGKFRAPARCAILFNSTGDFAETAPWLNGGTATDEVWISFDLLVPNSMFGGGSPARTETCTLYTGTSPFFRWHGSGVNDVQAQYSVDAGANWVNWGSTFNPPPNVLHTFTLRVQINSATATMSTWLGDIPVATGGAIDLSAITTATKWRWTGQTFFGGDYLSKVLIAESIDLRNHVLTPIPATGNGFNTAESGGYTDINEIVLDDTTAISFAANADRGTFTHAATTLPTSHVIVGTVVSSRVRKGASGIANYQHVLRIGGTNYDSSSVATLDTAYQPRQSLWATDPSTSAAFVAVPTEFGGKGVT